MRRDIFESRKEDINRTFMWHIAWVLPMAAVCCGLGYLIGRPFNWILYSLAIAAAIAISLWRFLARPILQYKSLQNQVDDDASSRKLIHTLPSLSAELLPSGRRFTLLVLYTILILLEPLFWILVGMRWLRDSSQRHKTKPDAGSSRGIVATRTQEDIELGNWSTQEAQQTSRA